MKYDAIGLVCKGAAALKRKDPGSAFALYELAENLRQVMSGEAAFESWGNCYVGGDNEPIDPTKMVPA